MILAGELSSGDVIDPVKRMMQFIADYEGEIPGAAAEQCGNYLDLNLSMAKYHARKYLREVFETPDETRFVYPE